MYGETKQAVDARVDQGRLSGQIKNIEEIIAGLFAQHNLIIDYAYKLNGFPLEKAQPAVEDRSCASSLVNDLDKIREALLQLGGRYDNLQTYLKTAI
jgi:hypothetical protein